MSEQERYEQLCSKFDMEMRELTASPSEDLTPELLKALERAYTALNWAKRFKVPRLNCDSYDIAAEIGSLLVKAIKVT